MALLLLKIDLLMLLILLLFWSVVAADTGDEGEDGRFEALEDLRWKLILKIVSYPKHHF